MLPDGFETKVLISYYILKLKILFVIFEMLHNPNKCILLYRCLFGLTTVGATYQILVNKMFMEQLGKTIEVYIDYMVVKSKKSENHFQDLEEAFNILYKFNMKLNHSKCNFVVWFRKFLGYMVTKRGIEASIEHIKSILSL